MRTEDTCPKCKHPYNDHYDSTWCLVDDCICPSKEEAEKIIKLMEGGRNEKS